MWVKITMIDMGSLRSGSSPVRRCESKSYLQHRTNVPYLSSPVRRCESKSPVFTRDRKNVLSSPVRRCESKYKDVCISTCWVIRHLRWGDVSQNPSPAIRIMSRRLSSPVRRCESKCCCVTPCVYGRRSSPVRRCESKCLKCNVKIL